MDSTPSQPQQEPRRRPRANLAGAFLVASLTGIGDALEPREEPPMIEDLDILDTTNLDWMAIDLDPVHPPSSVVVIRAWMLQ